MTTQHKSGLLTARNLVIASIFAAGFSLPFLAESQDFASHGPVNEDFFNTTSFSPEQIARDIAWPAAEVGQPAMLLGWLEFEETAGAAVRAPEEVEQPVRIDSDGQHGD